MSENSGEQITRRDLLKKAGKIVAGTVATAVVGGSPGVLAQELTPDLGNKEIAEKESPITITSVIIPLEEKMKGNPTAFALAIDTNTLGVDSGEIQKISVVAKEPGNRPEGHWSLSQEEIVRQLESGISDPTKVTRVGEVTISPVGLLYIPMIEFMQTPYEREIEGQGIKTIGPRNELTGNEPSKPRDFVSQTMFEITVEGPSEPRIFEVGPYR